MRTRHVYYGSLQNVSIREAPADDSSLEEEAEGQPNQEPEPKVATSSERSDDEGPESLTFQQGQQSLTVLDGEVEAVKSKLKAESKLKRIKHLEKFKTQKAASKRERKRAGEPMVSKNCKSSGTALGGSRDGFISEDILDAIGAAKHRETAVEKGVAKRDKTVTTTEKEACHIPLDQVYDGTQKLIRHSRGSVKVVELPKSQFAVAPIKPNALEYRRARLLLNVPSMPRVPMKSCMADVRKQHIIGFDRLAT